MIKPRLNPVGEWRLETLEEEIHSYELSIMNLGEIITILNQSNQPDKLETIRLCGERMKKEYEILRELIKEVKKLSTATVA